MRDYYWRNARPSLMLALVTAAIAAYSHWFAAPRLTERYERICAQNLNTLKIEQVAFTQQQQPAPTQSRDSESSSFKVKKDLLEETRLCLQRLYFANTEDEKIAYQLGLVFDAIGDLHLDEYRASVPIRSQGNDNSNDESARFQYAAAEKSMSLSMVNRRKAEELMQRVRNRKGQISSKASLWIIEKQLHRQAALRKSDLDSMAEQLASITNQPAAESGCPEKLCLSARSMLARVSLLQAYSIKSRLSISQRVVWAEKAYELYRELENEGTIEGSYAAEAYAGFDFDRASHVAFTATQQFWKTENLEFQGSEYFESVFRSLILMGSSGQAESFLAKQLDKLPVSERVPFLEACSVGCARLAVACIIHSQQSETANKEKAGKFISIAIHIYPNSEELAELFAFGGDSDGKDSIGPKLMAAARTIDRSGLVKLLEAIEQARQSREEGMKSAIISMAKQDLSVATLAVQVAAKLQQGELITRETAILWLQIINDTAPDIITAWFLRASLLISKEDYPSALKCYEGLQEKLPQNAQVRESISDLRLKISAGS
jgi:tetratricopeptide (TPR) repeat protein